MYDLALSCLSGCLMPTWVAQLLPICFPSCWLPTLVIQWLLIMLPACCLLVTNFNGCLYVACMLLTGYQLQWLLNGCLYVACMLPACCLLVTNFNGCLLCCLHVAYWLPTSMVAQWLPICCLHVACMLLTGYQLQWLPIMLPACCLLVTNFNGCLLCCLHVAYWLPTSMGAYNMLPACCLLLAYLLFNSCL